MNDFGDTEREGHRDRIRRLSDERSPWSWFIDKVAPFFLIAICGGMTMTYIQTIRISDALEVIKIDSQRIKADQDAKITLLQSELIALRSGLESVRDSAIKRAEFLETLKRVEQQLEIQGQRNKSK